MLPPVLRVTAPTSSDLAAVFVASEELSPASVEEASPAAVVSASVADSDEEADEDDDEDEEED